MNLRRYGIAHEALGSAQTTSHARGKLSCGFGECPERRLALAELALEAAAPSCARASREGSDAV